MKRAEVERNRQRNAALRRQIALDRAAVEREMVRVERMARDAVRDRAAWERERGEAIAALRVLCARFGDTEWDDSVPLAEIVTEHLVEPLEGMVGRVNRRIARLVAEIDRVNGPRPLPGTLPAPVPLVDVHRVLTVRAQAGRRGASGFVARCVCSWTSPLVDDSGLAERLGAEHVVARDADQAAEIS